jgi:hypothetical protein
MTDNEARVCGLVQYTSGSSVRIKLRNFDPSPVFHKRVKDRLLPLDLDVLCEAQYPNATLDTLAYPADDVRRPRL